MDCEYHILETLAYVQAIITFFLIKKTLVIWLLHIIKWFF